MKYTGYAYASTEKLALALYARKAAALGLTDLDIQRTKNGCVISAVRDGAIRSARIDGSFTLVDPAIDEALRKL